MAKPIQAWTKLAQPKDGTMRIAAHGGPLNGLYLRIDPSDEADVPMPGGKYLLTRGIYIWHCNPTPNNERE